MKKSNQTNDVPSVPAAGMRHGEGAAKSQPEASVPSKDVVLVHGLTEDKKGLRVLRAREQTVEIGEVRPLKEGQPINNDVVRLHARKGAPLVYDVETTYRPPRSPSESTDKSARVPEGPSRRTKAGPAQVASPAYRDNWDAIWARGAGTKNSSDLN